MIIIPISALSDNYIWVGRKDNDIFLVDPGEAKQVIEYVEKENVNLKAILITHNHSDHIGGVAELKNKFAVKVYGPKETSKLNDITVKEDDEFELFEEKVRVIKTAGHTKEHISYLTDNNLFCGDALFMAGCGRVFTKNYTEQYKTLQKYKAFSDEVKIYPAHEYTLANLNFARSIVESEDIEQTLIKCEELRRKNIPTLPSTIGLERKINLFFGAENVDEFKKLRDLRDNF